MESKQQMIDELWEFFFAYDITLENAGVKLEPIQKYINQRRGFNEVRAIYSWVFTQLMKVSKQAKGFENFSEKLRVQAQVLETTEYTNYLNDLKEIKKLWQNRPWKE